MRVFFTFIFFAFMFIVSGDCVDTVGWVNLAGASCVQYASNGWCANKRFATGFEWTGKYMGPGII